MNIDADSILKLSRRSFLGKASTGMGAVALASLLQENGLSAAESNDTSKLDRWTGAINPLQFTPKAKRVIWLYMAGGPSHLETLDHKPKLAEMHGQPMPESFTKGQPIAQLQNQELKCLAPQHQFEKFGANRPGNLLAVSEFRQRSPTTSASSARWSPKQSTTTRRTRS